MDLGRARSVLSGAVFLVLVAAVLVVAGVVPLPVPTPSEYERATVVVYDDNGTRLERVDARVADTFSKRYTGLSNTSSLGRNEGMLFVYDEAANRTYVMREMDFPIDIVFVGADGRINQIYHAPVPSETPEDELRQYRGRAKWVLEVNYNWTERNGVDVGDRVEVRNS